MPGTISLARIAVVFLGIGSTTFGGMWAATRKLENDLVARVGWLHARELHELFVVSTLIPAPKFLAFSGMVGYRLRGSWGAFVAISCLIAPAGAMVVVAVVAVSPDLLAGPLEPLNRTVGIAIVGLLFGNAAYQLRRAGGGRRQRVVGYVLALVTFVAIVLGAPLVGVALISFTVGAVLLGDRPDGGSRV